MEKKKKKSYHRWLYLEILWLRTAENLIDQLHTVQSSFLIALEYSTSLYFITKRIG